MQPVPLPLLPPWLLELLTLPLLRQVAADHLLEPLLLLLSFVALDVTVGTEPSFLIGHDEGMRISSGFLSSLYLLYAPS